MVTNDEEMHRAENKVWNYRNRAHPEPFYAQVDRAKFDALSPEQQRDIETIEDEIRAYKTERDARHRAQLIRDERERKLNVSGVEVTDAMMRAIVHDTLDVTPALEATRAWIADGNRRPWLALAGGVGVGKSIAGAYALANHEQPESLGRETVLWFSATEIARVFSSSFSELVDRAEAARTANLLVVDDVGTEPDHERMGTALVELLNSRQSARRQTIVTTNLTVAMWKTRFPDDRLHSRMAEAAQWTTCRGEDLRRAGARP